jgi:DDE superfamily endonuclease
LSKAVRASQVTEDFLAWLCERLAAEGRKALLLVWDNAPWHNSRRVRDWIRAHNRRVKREGGMRILVCALPTKSPWRESHRALLGARQTRHRRGGPETDGG